MKLSSLQSEFEQYMVFKDKNALRVVFATMVGNLIIDRDPIWLMLVAPSSGGKSTLIAPLGGIPHVFLVDDLTEKTLLSGFKGKKETSLLKIIGSGIMVFSDFTSILTKNPMSRGEILTQLKLVYDRKVTKYTGLGGSGWEGKMGVVAASTPDIYVYMEQGRSMGERFTYYWLEQPTNDEIVHKHEQVNKSSKTISGLMEASYQSYMQDIVTWSEKNKVPELLLTQEQMDAVRKAAIFCVHGKATIHTNFKTGRPDSIPNIAGVGRDIKIFNTMLHALLLMEAFEKETQTVAVDDSMIAIVEKCAYSSINRERRRIIEILVNSSNPLSSSKIGAMEGLGLEKEAVEMYLHPLHAVGLVTKKTGNPHTWWVEDEWTRAFIKRVASGVQDLTHVEGIDLPLEEDESEDPYANDPLASEFSKTTDV